MVCAGIRISISGIRVCTRRKNVIFVKFRRMIRGQLVGRSGKIKYLSRTTYVCGNRDCSSSSEEAVGYVRVRSLADRGGPEPREECELCGHQLQEQFSRRDISTKVRSRSRHNYF